VQLTEVIRLRRAIRAYTGQKVDDKTIRALLDAAIQAPSAMNAQPWGFAAVQDESTLQRYSDESKKLLLQTAMGDPKTGRYADSRSRS
jgi:nitroreductase